VSDINLASEFGEIIAKSYWSTQIRRSSRN